MMPKSTATSRPSASMNKLPGCMSAWKKPSRKAWRRKLWITVRPSAGRSKPLAASVARSLSGVPSIHSSVSTSRAVRSQSTVGTRKSRSSRVFSAISESAAASSRKSISSATERASVATTSTSRKRRASADTRSPVRAAKKKASRSTLEAALDAGAQHLHRDRLARAVVLDFGAMHLRDRGGGDRRAEAREHRIERPVEGGHDGRFRLILRERRQLVLQAFEVERDRRADHVRPRGEELPELDVSGPEPCQRGGELGFAGSSGARALDQAGERDRGLRRQRQRPRIDQPEHAFAREHVAGAGQAEEMGNGGDHNFQPECSATTPPVISRNETRRKPACSIIAAKALRLGKFADRLRPDTDRPRGRRSRPGRCAGSPGTNRARRARRGPAHRPRRIPGTGNGRRS